MELLLNVIWLAIALGACARLAVWAAGEPDRRRVALAAVATVCVLAVLFPVISMTDDLQETIAAADETVTVRRNLIAVAFELAPALLVTCCILAWIASSLLTAIGFLADTPLSFPTSRFAPVFALRGPPSFV